MSKAASAPGDYLLAGGEAELERLQLQARVWEPDAETLLDRVGVPAGASCLDLGCGAMGLLGPLSRRAGPSGRVLGVDIDAKQLLAARSYIAREGLANVRVEERDAFRTALPSDSYDVVHARFVAAPTGRGEELLSEMVRLARPGGAVVLQEPDASSWRCHPDRAEFNRLRETIEAVFAKGGGDFSAGRKSYGMFRRAGLEGVSLRGAILTLENGHPYNRVLCQFAASLRPRILQGGLMTERELDEAVAACEGLAQDPDGFVVSFLVLQVWGRKARGEA